MRSQKLEDRQQTTYGLRSLNGVETVAAMREGTAKRLKGGTTGDRLKAEKPKQGTTT